MTDPKPAQGDPAKVRAALLDVIENQIRSSDPPEVKQTLERLLADGLPREEAIRLIASALIGEVYGALKKGRYEPARYVANLNALPKMPWEKA